MTSSTVDKSVSSHSTVSRTSSRTNYRRRPSDGESDIPDTVSTSDGVLREYMDKVGILLALFSIIVIYGEVCTFIRFYFPLTDLLENIYPALKRSKLFIG